MVIFDMDGVLVDSEFLNFRVTCKVLERFDVFVSEDQLLVEFVGKKTEELATHFFPCDLISKRKFIEDVKREVSHEFERSLRATQDAHLFLQMDYDRCIVSSSHPARIRQCLEISDLLRYFDTELIFSTSIVKHGKPSPEIYDHLIARGFFERENTIVVEDTRVGIEAAKSAGLKTVAYFAGKHLKRSSARAALVASEPDFTCENANFLSNFLNEYQKNQQ